MADFYKYHGLGNDYLVLEPARFASALTPEAVRLICDRHRGVGGDGILWGPLPGEAAGAFRLRIFNPDGSEAEKSGNGLRIFARHVWAHHGAGDGPFALAVPGGTVQARVLDEAGGRLAVEMGHVRFDSASVPVTGPAREVLGEPLTVDGEALAVSAVSVGNPHCVVRWDQPTEAVARRLGPLLERHAWFPNRTNVQFMAPVDRHSIRIEIWERGAGYTMASGTSSCAAAAVAVRQGLCESPVAVHMPGGVLTIRFGEAFAAEMEGEVRAVASGTLAAELLAEAGLRRA